MALDDDIASVVEESRKLTNTVEKYTGQIRSELDTKKQEVDNYLENQLIRARTSAFEVDDEGGWDRVFSIGHRLPVELTLYFTGGFYGPGSITLHLLVNNAGGLHVQTISKLGSQYATKIRSTYKEDAASNGPSFIEIWFPHRSGQRIPFSIRALAHGLQPISCDDEIQGVNLPPLSVTTEEIVL